jgi:FO synthase subunit 2
MSPGLTDTGLPSPSLVGRWLRAATADPAALPDEGYAALLGADGPRLDELCELADSLREQAVGNGLTYVVNRNLDPSAVAGPDPGSRQRLAALVAEAGELGATEICMQGPLPPDSDDDYLDLIAAVKASGPEIHLHAFRPPELLDGAARRGMPLEAFLLAAREAGLGSVPGTAARILDDEVRTRLAGGPDLPVSRWVEVIEAAHRAGLPSTATIVFGHIETPAHQVAHLRTLAGIQGRTGGFTEFIAMPFVPAASPSAGSPAPAPAPSGLPAPALSSGLPAPALSSGFPAPTPAPGLVGANVPGPSWRQVRAVHAVARLMLHERIGNIQAAWPKFGLDASVDLLRSGANDLGGLLLDGRLAPDAGAEAGLVLTLDDIERVARQLGRPVWQRTTSYGKVIAGV